MVRMIHADCMAEMAKMRDGEYDLAIVDPPYGIGFDGEDSSMVQSTSSGKWKSARGKGYTQKAWDHSAPSADYFSELFRVSKNQIVWGGNYFDLPRTGGWVVWDKQKPEDFSLSQGEMAWCSLSESLRFFRWLWHGFQQEAGEREDRIHPTQKPVALYKWLLTKYAKPGQTILDTHGGSGSIAIACHDLGFDLTWMELDADYYASAVKRYETHASQLSLFAPEPEKKPKQVDLLS